MLSILADTFMIAARTDHWAARGAASDDRGPKPRKGWAIRRGEAPAGRGDVVDF